MNSDSSLQHFSAFVKSIGLILCAVALFWSVRPSLFEPPARIESDVVNRRLRAVWFAAMAYFVDYSTPPAQNAQAGPPSVLTTPVAYLIASRRDPYALGAWESDVASDPSGRRTIERVGEILAALFGLRAAGLLLALGLGRSGKARRAAELCAAALILGLWLAGARRFGPVHLGLGALAGIGLGAFGLFALRRLTQGTLLTLAAGVCFTVFGLVTARGPLLGAGEVLAAAAALRTAFFYWTLRVRRAKGSAVGPYALRLPGHAFFFALCLYLAIASSLALLAISRSHVKERKHIQRLEEGIAPLAYAARPDFFAASSNGPDCRREWREEILFRLLDEEGPSAAEAYLIRFSYDPTNGPRSEGDFLVFGQRPAPEAGP